MDKLTVVAWNAINGAPMVFEESALSVIAARDARIKELREALTFYGRNLQRRASNSELIYMTPLEHDCGDRARAALSKEA